MQQVGVMSSLSAGRRTAVHVCSSSSTRVAPLAPKRAQGRMRRGSQQVLSDFAGFRRAGALDTLGSSSSRSFQQAVVASGSKGGKRTRMATTMMFER